jgi:hypothetical protein
VRRSSCEDFESRHPYQIPKSFSGGSLEQVNRELFRLGFGCSALLFLSIVFVERGVCVARNIKAKRQIFNFVSEGSKGHEIVNYLIADGSSRSICVFSSSFS